MNVNVHGYVSFRSALLILVLASSLSAQSAGSLFKKGRKAQEKGDFPNAYLLYSQALALDPSNDKIRAYALAVQRPATEKLKIGFAAEDKSPAQVLETAALPAISDDDLYEAREKMAPPELKGTPGEKSFNLTGDSKQLFEKVAGEFGLQVVFDSDYQAVQNVRFQLDNTDWQDALHALEAVTGAFIVAVNEKVALVAKDTTQKRAEIEPHMSVLVPFPVALTPQEVQEAARAVQTTFDITKVAIDNNKQQVLFRDRVSRVKPALELFRQLTTYRAQVMIEVQLLTASETSAISYGLRLPTSFPIIYIGSGSKSAPSIPSGITGLIKLGGGFTMWGLGLSGSELFANMTKSSTRTLTNTELRGVDSQPMTLHVGDRYPLQTQAYIGDTSGPGTVYRPPPTIQFEDLGVVIKLTPRIHNIDEVTIDVEAELKVLGGEALNGIPVISNRKFASRVRMRFDETAVLSGLFSDGRTRGWSGLPLPPPLRAYTMNDENSQVLVTLTPKLISYPPTEFPTRAIRTGSETRPLTPLE